MTYRTRRSHAILGGGGERKAVVSLALATRREEGIFAGGT